MADCLVNVRPIGFIESIFKEKNGTPRQANVCKTSKARLTVSKRIFTNPNHALDGLSDFSHIWLIFLFHKNSNSRFPAKVSPPRLDGRRVGVLATRSPHRPNPIGLSLAKLDKIAGDSLYLSMIDLLDGTPVIDIKPFIPQYDRPLPSNSVLPIESRTNLEVSNEPDDSVSVPDWICRPPIAELRVAFTERAVAQLKLLCCRQPLNDDVVGDCSFLRTFRAIEDILKEDPRSVYRRSQCKDRLYYLSVLSVHLTCWFDDEDRVVEVLKVKQIIDQGTENKND